MNSLATKRRYRSGLRAAQKELTKDVILEAILRQIAKHGLVKLSIQNAAKDAGVSPVTIYRYFPTKTVLLDALYDWSVRFFAADNQTKSLPQFPRDLDSFLKNRFVSYEKNYEMIKVFHAAAYASPEVGAEVRKRSQQQLLAMYRQAWSDATKRLSPSKAKELIAVFYILSSSYTWRELKERLGFDTEEILRLSSRVIKDTVQSYISGDSLSGPSK